MSVEIFAAYHAMKDVQDELTPIGAEAVWTFIWEVKALQIKIWYKINNEHRSVLVHLNEKDFKGGYVDKILEQRIEMIAQDISDQRYLCTQKERL